MRVLIIMTIVIVNVAWSANFYDSEFDLTNAHGDARVEIENTLSEMYKEFPFQLNQDLAFLRHRLAKRPKFVNREDEIPWIKHDVFLINQLMFELSPYNKNKQILSLLETFQNLKEEYTKILELQRIISK